ncbi:MAG: asparagine synthase (glutamine-hydrolyzing) [Luteitalea sp.]|nr:asparagine synthase (glutamine-hydrolyzing) [Luteitalea sp.]
MCGIAGILNFDWAAPVNARLLRDMTDAIAHRGPDGRGEYVSGCVGLGHRRLSIIDLSRGGQPMCNEDASVWVTYNGEIYNFADVRSDLESRGHMFKSASDTEVIVHAYEEWGEQAVQRLRGMFAFALWDDRKQQLLLARDRVGIKPLYYTNTGKAFLFASELKSLLVHPAVSRRLSARAIDRFLTYYYLPGAETAFADIYKLEPGHCLIVKDGRVRKEQYWDLCFDEPHRWRSFSEAVEALQDLLRQTVKDHMTSDVPVGVLLSGGVDSTGVLRYAAEEAGDAVHSFTVGFAGEGFADERPYARLAAQRYGTRHYDIPLTPYEFLEFLPQYVWHMEEPVCEPPAVALYYVSRLARETGVKVLLSGEGGDEAFAGYQNYRNLLFLERAKSALGSAKPLLRSTLHAFARLGWNRVEPYSKLIDLPLSSYYLSRTATPETPFNRLKSALYRAELNEALRDRESNEATRGLFERVREQPLLDRMLYVDTKTWLPDDLLVKADKMTMATSVELRVPLLDFRVLEFAASLPQSFKLRGWSGKRILKAALKGSVPREILERPKSGFPVPYERWLRADLKEFVGDTLLTPTAALTKYFRTSALDTIVEGFFRDGKGGKEVFSLLVLELWLQQFGTAETQHGSPMLAKPPSARQEEYLEAFLVNRTGT